MGLIITLAGTELSDQEAHLCSHPALDGVILFPKNIQSVAQSKRLCQQLKRIKRSLEIAIDHEGGRVNRFTKLGYRQHSARITGALSQTSLSLAQAMLDQEMKPLAELAKEIGIDTFLGPCVDRDFGCSVISGFDRSYGYDKGQVIDCASMFIDVCHHAGLNCVIKHYPGHGAAYGDSHYQAPWDMRCAEDIFEDASVFATLLQKYPQVGMMSAHVIYPASDNGSIATTSKYWYEQSLRLVNGNPSRLWSDCMAMKAQKHLSNHFLSRWMHSYKMILCHQPLAVYQELLSCLGLVTLS